MPLVHYCSECAYPNEYTLDKPRFCSSCGENISQISISSVNNLSKKSSKVIAELEEEVIDINASDFSVEPIEIERNKGIKFGDWAQQSIVDSLTPRIKGVKINTEKELQLIRTEGGMGGMKRHEIDDDGKIKTINSYEK